MCPAFDTLLFKCSHTPRSHPISTFIHHVCLVRLCVLAVPRKRDRSPLALGPTDPPIQPPTAVLPNIPSLHPFIHSSLQMVRGFIHLHHYSRFPMQARAIPACWNLYRTTSTLEGPLHSSSSSSSSSSSAWIKVGVSPTTPVSYAYIVCSCSSSWPWS
jgi:hypothetical protein